MPWTPPPAPGLARPAERARHRGRRRRAPRLPRSRRAAGDRVREHRPRRLRRRHLAPALRRCSSTRSAPRPGSRSPAASSPAPTCCGSCASASCSPRPGPPTRRSSTRRSSEPVFVVGTGRSGTSILHELLALDPANRTPATWELLFPGEVLGARRRHVPARRPRRPRVLGRPAARVRVDAPQRRRRAERVHLPHDARVPVRPVGRHVRGAVVRGVPRRRRPDRGLPLPPQGAADAPAARARGALGAQGTEPPRASCAPCSRSTPTRASCRSIATR